MKRAPQIQTMLPQTPQELPLRDLSDPEAEFPGGWAQWNCYSGCRWLKDHVPGFEDSVICGFYSASWYRNQPEYNPDTQWFTANDSGHNFLLVAGRWIVDIWLAWYVCEVDDIVVCDLQNPQDLATLKMYYGDPSRWVTTVDGVLQWVFGEGRPAPVRQPFLDSR